MSETVILVNERGIVNDANPLQVTGGGGGGGGDASAINQTTIIGEIGATNETSAAADNSTSGLNGLVKRLLARFTSIFGDTTDAAVTAGATGTIAAKLRSISRDLVANIVLAAGENHIGQVSGHSAPITIVPTVTNGAPAYTSGDSVGGKMTLANAVRVSGGTGWLASLQIMDASNQKPSGTLLVFNADLAVTYTDNAAAALSTADAAKIVAQIAISTGDYTVINNRSIANPMFNPKQVKAISGTSLYSIFVVSSTPTFAATTDLQFIFGFAQD